VVVIACDVKVRYFQGVAGFYPDGAVAYSASVLDLFDVAERVSQVVPISGDPRMARICKGRL